MRKLSALDTQARAAEKAGDYPTVEACYRAYGAMLPGTPEGPLRLARLYDRMGRDRDAYLQYRLAVADYGTRATSHRDDPKLLARYGDLCVRFGSSEEAKRSYALAAALSDRENTAEPLTLPRNGSFGSLKAAAHTAAAIDFWGSGYREESLRELDTAVTADPAYWVARYYRAAKYTWVGRFADSIREAALAERLAPAKDKEWVITMRRNRGIPDAQGRVLPILPVPRPGIGIERREG